MHVGDSFKHTKFMINICEIEQLNAPLPFGGQKKDLDPIRYFFHKGKSVTFGITYTYKIEISKIMEQNLGFDIS